MLRSFYAGCPFWNRADGCVPADAAQAKWFFDKSVWQKLFRTMSDCGYETVVLESDGCIGLGEDIREMSHWILSTAIDYEIAPMLALACRAGDSKLPKRTLAMLEEFTEAVGIVLYPCNHGIDACSAALEVVDAARPDAAVWVNTDVLDAQNVTGLSRRGGRRISYVVNYCRRGLLDYGPDNAFSVWAEALEHSDIIALVSPPNFQPWTSFSYDTVTGALDQMEGLELGGLILGSISPADWPRTSDTGFKYQWQRDLIYLLAWAGEDILEMADEGRPKWLKRNQKLVAGFSSGSRVLELLGMYLWPRGAEAWFPQFAAKLIDGQWSLLSISDLLSPDFYSPGDGQCLWEELTGERPQFVPQHFEGRQLPDLYGVEEFLEEISDLSDLALEAAEKGMRNDSGEKELPFLARDAYCFAKLGKVWAHRVSAALASGRGNNTTAARHAQDAMDEFREMVRADSAHRGTFTVSLEGRVLQVEWSSVCRILEAELVDIMNGSFKSGAEYPALQ